MQAATGSQFNFTGSNAIDVKDHVLTVNGSNVNFQGKVVINEVLGSSFNAGGSLVKSGTNTLILQGTANTYTGLDTSSLNPNGTQIAGGTLGIYGDGSLGKVPAVSYNNIQFTGSGGTLQDTANNISLDSKRGVSVASGATATFDSNGNTFTVNGIITGSGNLAKTGSGIVVLTGANSFIGTTTVNAGTLQAGVGTLVSTSSVAVNSGGSLLLSGVGRHIGANTPVTLNGGTFNTGGLSEPSNTAGGGSIGALTLTATSVLNFGPGNSSILQFGGVGVHTLSTMLQVINWDGTPVTGGAGDRLLFSGLLADFTSKYSQTDVSFNGNTGYAVAQFGDYYEVTSGVVPVPEPTTWLAGFLALGTLGYSQRRRLQGLLPAGLRAAA